VIALGLEEDHIPDYQAKTSLELEEEHRILHVIVSRARYALVLTRVDETTMKSYTFARKPSRWLPLLQPAITEVW
jgi:superfamily I DNA/RNA helicase